MSAPKTPVASDLLTVDQGRRAQCLAVVLTLVSGLNVHIATAVKIAKWLYDGGEHA